MKSVSVKTLTTGLGAVSDNVANSSVTAVVTDSRNIKDGEIFVAIAGEHFDGHDFVAAALKDGAVLAVVERPVEQAEQSRQLVVQSSLDAMICMGKNYRALFDTKLVGITGSVGKTTTKEFVACALEPFGRILKTEGNQNNELGVPNTLFALSDEHDIGVIEMGMTGLGDIEKLSLATKPCGGVITNVGVAHLEHLKTRENILAAKLELTLGIQQGGFLVVNDDNDLLHTAQYPQHLRLVRVAIDSTDADIKAENISFNDYTTTFDIKNSLNGESYAAEIPTLGRHNVYNALSAYAVAFCLELDGQTAVQAMGEYQSVGMRQKIITLDSVVVIEDCYNANPDSVKAALETLMSVPDVTARVAVLGDMRELGDITEQAHRDIGRLCATLGLDGVVAYGDTAHFIADEAKACGMTNAAFAEDRLTAMDYLTEFCGSGAAVLFKASRSVRLEEVMELFYRQRG